MMLANDPIYKCKDDGIYIFKAAAIELPALNLIVVAKPLVIFLEQAIKAYSSSQFLLEEKKN